MDCFQCQLHILVLQLLLLTQRLLVCQKAMWLRMAAAATSTSALVDGGTVVQAACVHAWMEGKEV